MLPAKKMDDCSLRHLIGSDVELKLPEIFVPDVEVDILQVDKKSVDLGIEIS